MHDTADAAWSAVWAGSPAEMSRDQVATLLNSVRTVRSCLDAIEMLAARRLRTLHASGRAGAATELPESAGGRSERQARAATAREELCRDMPAVEAAFAAAEVTAEHVDAIASAANGLPEPVRDEFQSEADVLLRRTAIVSLDVFQRECRELAKHLLARSRAGNDVDELAEQRAASRITRWIDRQTGMHHTHVELDPIRDAKLGAAINAQLATLRTSGVQHDWQQLHVEALLGTICGSSPCDSTHAASDDRTVVVDRIPEVTALVDVRFLAELVDHGICETQNGEPVPIAVMRRLCCDAEIIPVVLGGGSEVLDQGRAARTATRAQRRALRAMYRSCAHPHCRVGFDACRIHHIRWWWRDLGPTDLNNLLPLCEQHHHLVHEGGWNLTMTPERVATWTRPDGVVDHVGPTIDRRPTTRPLRL